MRVTALILWITLGSASCLAQANQQKAAVDRAREILQASLTAMGGKERIGNVSDVSIQYVANNHLRGQNVNPYQPSFAGGMKGEMIFDRAQGHIVNEVKVQFPGGIRFWQKFIKKGNQGFFIDLYGNGSQPTSVAPIPAGGVYNLVRRIPVFWLYDVAKLDTIARWVAKESYMGVDHDVVEITQPPLKYKLFVNSINGLPSKYETRSDNAVTGDQLDEMIFMGYKQVNGIFIPSGVSARANGDEVFYFTHLDTKINTGYDPRVLEFPAGFTLASAQPPAPELKEVSKNIFFIEEQITGYNSTFVNFKDYIVVLDAPIGTQFSKVTLDQINKKFPGKKVKYALISHFHYDHTSGLPFFLANGAEVILQDGLQQFVTDMVNAKHSLQPSPLTNETKQVKFVPVKDSWVLEDTSMKMEVVVGKTSHTDYMLLAYFPQQKLVWQADFIVVGQAPGKIPPGFTVNEEFQKIIGDRGWKVDKVIGVHGRPTTTADLKEMLDKKKLNAIPFFD